MFCFSAFSPPQGVYRWDYKLLIDPVGANNVYPSIATSTTIKKLVNILRPNKDEMKNKRADAEKKKVKLIAWVVMAGKEDNDFDYHLVLKSLTGNDSMIAEIPDPEQVKLKGFPNLKKDYSKGRAFVERAVDNNPGSVRPVDHPVKVNITGIVFFDKTAHGKGHSKNGVEIHPVLKISPAQ